jgi:hypothetical protein
MTRISVNAMLQWPALTKLEIITISIVEMKTNEYKKLEKRLLPARIHNLESALITDVQMRSSSSKSRRLISSISQSDLIDQKSAFQAELIDDSYSKSSLIMKDGVTFQSRVISDISLGSGVSIRDIMSLRHDPRSIFLSPDVVSYPGLTSNVIKSGRQIDLHEWC